VTDRARVHLTISIDVSFDGGRHWRMVAMPADTGRYTIPATLLSATGRARVRLRASDGFNQVLVISRLLRIARG
jgi:hypothetical protein